MKNACFAHLTIYTVEQNALFLGLSALTNMLNVEYVRPEITDSNDAEAWKKVWQEVERLIWEADGFLITDSMVLDNADFREILHKRVKDGVRVLICPDINNLSQCNDFLKHYGLSGTTTRLLSPGQDPNTITIDRGPDTFLEEKLLRGVKLVEINAPDAVEYSSEAVPVLLAPEHCWAVDRKTDFPSDWNRQRHACIAKWEGETGGAVVALGAYIFGDQIRRWTDLKRIPAIQQNARLVANLVRYGIKQEDSAETGISPSQLLERIEKNLADFVLLVLKKQLGIDDWWANGVPVEIRKECASRQEEEARRKFPKEAFLDLIHFRTIMEKNWPFYEPYFKALGLSQGKQKSLEWLARLNELRRLRAHPLKMHLAEYTWSSDEIAFIQEADYRALQLIRSLSVGAS